MKKTRYALIALIVILSLTACETVRSKPSTAVLPDVPEYSKPVQKKAADEMSEWCDKMPTVCDILLPDYIVMRDQTRAAKKLLK